eukprot:403349155
MVEFNPLPGDQIPQEPFDMSDLGALPNHMEFSNPLHSSGNIMEGRGILERDILDDIPFDPGMDGRMQGNGMRGLNQRPPFRPQSGMSNSQKPGMGGMDNNNFKSYQSNQPSSGTYTVNNSNESGFFRSTGFLVVILVIAVLACLCLTTVCMYAEEEVEDQTEGEENQKRQRVRGKKKKVAKQIDQEKEGLEDHQDGQNMNSNESTQNTTNPNQQTAGRRSQKNTDQRGYENESDRNSEEYDSEDDYDSEEEYRRRRQRRRERMMRRQNKSNSYKNNGQAPLGVTTYTQTQDTDFPITQQNTTQATYSQNISQSKQQKVGIDSNKKQVQEQVSNQSQTNVSKGQKKKVKKTLNSKSISEQSEIQSITEMSGLLTVKKDQDSWNVTEKNNNTNPSKVLNNHAKSGKSKKD